MSARRSVARPSAAFAAALSIVLVAGTPTARAQGPVYRNGFTDAQAGGAAAGWSAQRLFSPRAGVSMLGRFHNDQAVLSLSKLAPHAGVVVAFDLHVIGAWAGERTGAAPTTFMVMLDDAVLLNSSLATDDGDAHTPRRQSFPDEPGAAAHPAALGAYKLNALGVRENGKTQPDAVYRLVFAVPHAADALRLKLSAANLPGELADASWAVDNAVVYTVNQTADLDRARTAARDAVTQLSLGLPGGVMLAPAVDADSPAPAHLPDTFDSRAGSLMTFGALEVAPARDGSPNSIIPDAATQGRAMSFDLIDAQLAVVSARESVGLPAMGAARSAIAAVPAIAARIEQPVIRRVSTQVYQSRFGAGVGNEWDAPSHGVGPRGERFAGPYGNKAVSLALDELPPHDQLVIEADLYTIGDWQGDGPNPSKFSVSLDGHSLMSESFATEDGGLKRTQSYPGGGGRRRLPGADASAIDALGYPPIGDVKNGAAGDATYRLRFVVPHDSSTGTLQFSASGLSSKGASWGVDNVTVVASGNKSMRFADATGEEPDDNADDGTYNNPFVRAPGQEWNVHELEKSPSGEAFLGPLHNQTASLTVSNFPQHTHLVIAADVVVIGDWQGNTPDPSQFAITLSDGTQVFATTFASDGGESDATQNYPDSGPAQPAGCGRVRRRLARLQRPWFQVAARCDVPPALYGSPRPVEGDHQLHRQRSPRRQG
ncbi:MAG: hypothetical protein QM783_01355 [Phycisphaerales bacterium]